MLLLPVFALRRQTSCNGRPSCGGASVCRICGKQGLSYNILSYFDLLHALLSLDIPLAEYSLIIGKNALMFHSQAKSDES
jgi:hypothetical protein